MSNEIQSEEVTTRTTFLNYLHRLTVLAQSRFRWTGLPVGVTTRLIEKGLFRYGSIVFYRHDVPLTEQQLKLNEFINEYEIYNGRFFSLPYTYESLDMYGDPVLLRAYGLNGYNHSVISDVNSVIMRNNCIGSNTEDTIIMFASRLTAALRTQDLNIHNQRMSELWLCDESQRNTLRNIFKKMDNFEPRIMGVKNVLDLDSMVKVINSQVPYIADKLSEYKEDLWDEILTFFGLSRQNKKKERLVSTEVESNNQFANASINTMLESRRAAMWDIKRIFPECSEIDVHVNDLEDTEYKLMEMEQEGENV